MASMQKAGTPLSGKKKREKRKEEKRKEYVDPYHHHHHHHCYDICLTRPCSSRQFGEPPLGRVASAWGCCFFWGKKLALLSAVVVVVVVVVIVDARQGCIILDV